MRVEDFRKYAHEFADWMADYIEQVEKYPVKSGVKPGTIKNSLPDHAPVHGEPIDEIFSDFKDIILPGITHWQSPNYYAYFQANASPPSMLAEMLTATLGVQGMKWETSPAATELEEVVMEWLMRAMGIPDTWSGVIQDTASSATLVALLTAREVYSQFSINTNGYDGSKKYRVYCSVDTHSSIEKDARIAGVGSANVVKIPVDSARSMQVTALEERIEQDKANGLTPLCIVATIGTTGTLGVDPVDKLADIATREKIWLHIDAAYAGSALLLPEYQYLIDGIEKADSFVFNPHKWLFTNFDCSAYFVKDADQLTRTFSILPEYLKTASDGMVNNYCDWGIPLGRRFRSLKLWFVLRHYGIEGIQIRLRAHIETAQWLEAEINRAPDFEMVMPRFLNLVCFRFTGVPQQLLNDTNRLLMHILNSSGKLFLTHTVVDGIFTLRMSIGQTYVTQTHVETAWQLIRKASEELQSAPGQKEKENRS